MTQHPLIFHLYLSRLLLFPVSPSLLCLCHFLRASFSPLTKHFHNECSFTSPIFHLYKCFLPLSFTFLAHSSIDCHCSHALHTFIFTTWFSPRCPTLQYTIWPGLPATAGSRAGKGRPGPGGPGRPARPGGQPGYRGLREEDPPPGAGETWAEPQTARWGWPKSPPGCVCRCESRTCTLKHYNLRMRVNVDISEATVYTHRRYFTFRADKMQKTVFF